MTIDESVRSVAARAYTIPTDNPESDGTASWNSTTIVIVHVQAGGRQGIGYTYTDASVSGLIAAILARVVEGRDAMDPQGAWRAMQIAVRNLGRAGIAATGISAVDAALWDLKAKLLDLPLATLLGRFRDTVPIYGSGGFTSYDDRQLTDQLAGWVERDGCRWVKMKIGTDAGSDPARVATAKQAIGAAELFVDANGAYTVKQAVHFARMFATEQDVRWFEEPVSSDDLDGLRRVRDLAPPPMEVAAANTAMSWIISGGCSRPRLWMCSRPTPRAAAVSPASCRRLHCARPSTSTCPPIVPLPCIGTSAAPLRVFVTSNGFMITFGSKGCCLTARPRRTRATSHRTRLLLGLD